MKEQATGTVADSKKEAEAAVAPPPATTKSPRPKKSFLKKVSAAVVIFLLATGGGALGAWAVFDQNDGGADGVSGAKDDGNKIVLQSEEGIAKVADEVSPSVVSIRTDNPTRRGLVQGAGTGIVVSKDGYVMTNKHVVSEASSASVTTASGDIYEKVKIIGVDPLNDVAFLKIDNAKNLTPAEIGESSTLRIGQTVVAIGNSLGEYQNTVTSGIVSGLGRPVAAQSQDGSQAESLSDLIQTDAAINPGNSGGPLVNLSGQVVGINTAVASDAQGIGFAIPVNAVKGILEGVLKEGKVARAYIGVSYVDITPAIAREKKLSVTSGALVQGGRNGEAVQKDGPADKAGIREGDIITKVGELQVGKSGGVSSLIAAYRPGETVALTILRDGKEMVKQVRLATYTAPEREAASAPSQQQPELREDSFWRQFGF
jgi:serine protease Do